MTFFSGLSARRTPSAQGPTGLSVLWWMLKAAGFVVMDRYCRTSTPAPDADDTL